MRHQLRRVPAQRQGQDLCHSAAQIMGRFHASPTSSGRDDCRTRMRVTRFVMRPAASAIITGYGKIDFPSWGMFNDGFHEQGE